MNDKIPFEIIHKGIIDSTIPLSNKMINEGKQENFLLNCDEQTHSRGSGDPKIAKPERKCFNNIKY